MCSVRTSSAHTRLLARLCACCFVFALLPQPTLLLILLLHHQISNQSSMVDRNLSAPVRPLQAHHSLTSPFNVSQLRLLIRRRSLLWNLPNLRCRRGFCFQFTAASTKTPCTKAQYVKLTDRTIAFKFDSLKDAERAVKHPNPAIARETLDLLGPSELMKTSEWVRLAGASEPRHFVHPLEGQVKTSSLRSRPPNG